VTPFLAVRLALLTWSWRRVVAGGIVTCLLAPVLMAAIVAGTQQEPAGPLVTPVRAATLTQAFGCTALAIEPWSEECPSHHFHSGLDLAAALDTPIYAATAGTVIVRRERGGYGLYILVVRDARLSTLYGHLDTPLVETGHTVTRGQPIALMGSTGNSTGPHLHFEVRIAGVPVDPAPLVAELLTGGGR
jgi:murein DD-endopeptidase MepM/ murein hydrolase activator NlpD